MRNGGIDKLLLDAQIAETRPQKGGRIVINKGQITPGLVRVLEAMVSLINAKTPGLSLRSHLSGATMSQSHTLLDLMEAFLLERLPG